jgi:hypothetical protein
MPTCFKNFLLFDVIGEWRDKTTPFELTARGHCQRDASDQLWGKGEKRFYALVPANAAVSPNRLVILLSFLLCSLAHVT